MSANREIAYEKRVHIARLMAQGLGSLEIAERTGMRRTSVSGAMLEIESNGVGEPKARDEHDDNGVSCSKNRALEKEAKQASDCLRDEMKNAFERFEKRHRLQPGEGQFLLMNAGVRL